MCLRNPVKIKPQKAITAYKVLGVDINTGEFVSPITKVADWKTGKEHIGEAHRPTHKFGDREMSLLLDHFSYQVGAQFDKIVRHSKGFHGAVHTFKTLDEAKAWAKRINMFLDFNSYVICECTIPADSEYVFEGTVEIGNDFLGEGYASSSVILGEMVYHENYPA